MSDTKIMREPVENATRLSLAGAISVVIPAFNAAKFLPETLQSVFNQTVPVLEVIVVDDGSTDRTPEVMERFRDSVVYLRKPNGGPSSARNMGILEARGEWIAFLDADDLWLPQRLEREMAIIKDTAADFMFSDASVVNTKIAGGPVSTPSWLTNIKRKDRVGDELVDSVMRDPFGLLLEQGCFIMVSTVLVRRLSLLRAGLFDESMGACEDYEFFLRLALHCRVGFTPESLIVRTIHGANLSLDRAAMRKGKMQLWEKASQMKEIRMRPKWRKLVRAMNAALFMEAGIRCADNHETTKARENLKQSLESHFSTRAAMHWALLFLPAKWGSSVRHAIRSLIYFGRERT